MHHDLKIDPNSFAAVVAGIKPFEKWEYRFVKPDGHPPLGQLNYLGEQGWELVCIDYGHLILKRRIA